jgi:hypothetical protein
MRNKSITHRGRTFTRRSVVTLIVLVLLATVPASSVETRLPVGVGIAKGFFDPCDARDDNDRLNLDLTGRIPAGGRYQTVTATIGTQWYCWLDTFTFTFTGASQTSSYTWNCLASHIGGHGAVTSVDFNELFGGEGPGFFGDWILYPGATMKFSAICTTVGYVWHGRFSLQVILALVDYRPDSPNYDSSGVYQLAGIFTTKVL